MTHIIAIGGGEIGRPGTKPETTPIDKHIISLTGKDGARVLFFPTASNDSPLYSEIFRKHYGGSLGCQVEILNLYNKPSQKEIKELINWAEIIYVGGGNTLRMMTLWRRLGVDNLLIKAHKDGKVLCGLSAGAICWFESGLSDSRRFTSHRKDWPYINVHGLNLIDLIICPHFDKESSRQPVLRQYLKTKNRIAIALDNCAAIEISDDNYRIITSQQGAKAYKLFWRDKKYYKEALISKELTSLAELVG